MKRYSEDCPLNARILIDYDSSNVLFDYPSHGFFKSFLAIYGSFWVSVSLLLSPFLIFLSFFFNGLITLIYFIVCFELVIFSLFFTFRYDLIKESFPKFNFKLYRLIGSRVYRVRKARLNSRVFEIPLFKNVMLSYEATGEFGELLQRVRVVEHEINEVTQRVLCGDKVKPCDSFWKARFVFSSVPRSGELLVEFM